MTRSLGIRAAAGPRTTLTRIPLYPGPLPTLRPDRPPWPGRIHRGGGVALHIRHTPGPERGELAVYLHGLGGSASNFTDLAGLLAGARLPGMAIDLPGFGRTAPPEGFDYALDSHAEVIAAFLASCGPVHLLGNSLGGAVALLVAARRPQLVRTLTLLAPAMPDLRIDPRRISDPRMALTVLPVVGNWARRAMGRVTTADKVVSVRKAPRTTAALPRGRLFVLPRTGHVPQIERPLSTARAVLGMIDAVACGQW